MRVVIAIVKWGALALIVAILGVGGWLYWAPPELVRLGAAYSAKIVCSNAFIAGRDAREVLTVDVQSPGHPLLGYMRVETDPSQGRTTASLLGLFAPATAVWREGHGCVSVPDGDLETAALPPLPVNTASNRAAPWPLGDRVEANEDPAIAAILDDPELQGPGMRAIVVVHDGRIVGERYGEGFSPEMPLLGWSMTKTVTAAIVGTLVGEGSLSLDRSDLMDVWRVDDRSEVTLADLLAMSSGLEFNEDYGDVTDITRMLYLEPDMASFASGKQLAGERGNSFNYSSGTSVLVSRIWQNSFEDQADALAWPYRALFGPLGMTGAVFETDARGTFVGSSYLYATARDWARFGQFLLQDGVWRGHRILPEGYVAWMREPVPASDGAYGRGHLWLQGPRAGTPKDRHPDEGFDLPDDAFWLLGHDGQSTVVVPSLDLVVVRMGLTPSRLGYKPQALLEALAPVVAD
jgi:CubicO group peptidase (beta-lactamase class C family)